MASDYAVEVLLRQAIMVFEQEAPRMTFEICPLADDLIEELKRGRSDLLVTIDTAISTELPHVQLFEDDYVVIGWTGNEALSSGMTRELYGQLGHVVTRFGRARVPAFEEWALRSMSIRRRIEVIAPDFTSVASLVIDTHRIATIHRRLATRLAATMPLQIIEVPFEIPRIRQAVQWASSSNTDPAIAWVVKRLREVAAAS